MATPGPSPRPAALKLLNGRHAGVDSSGMKVELPPMFVRGAPEMPEIVRMDDEAAAAWNRLVPELERLDLLKPIDGDVLAGYCLCVSRLYAASKDIKDRGLIVLGRLDVEVKNPSVGIAAECTRELRMYAQEFGLTPSAEGRLHTAPSNDEAEDAEAFN